MRRLPFRQGISFFIALAAITLLSRCATYASRVAEPRRLFEMGSYEAAIEDLKKYADNKDNDELLYLMDLGLVYHGAGKYKDAISAFLRADRLAEIKDYTSISAEAGAFILNDDVKTYKGEDFEKILIHVYLAMDYTMLNEWEDALVECRKVNHMLDLLIAVGKIPYEQNSFAKYLAAVLFEARGELNDAFVDYRTVLKWQSSFPYLPQPLLRISDRMGMSQEFQEFRTRFPGVKDYKMGKNEGQVILLLESGKGPVKVPNPAFHLMAKFQKRSYASDYAWLRDGFNGTRVRTYPLYDIETTAIRELDNKAAAIIAKKVGGYVAKEAIAAGVAAQTKSEAAGLITSLLLHATDHADVRSWSTLPAKLQLARMVVPSGRHDILLDRVNAFGAQIPAMHRWAGVEVKPGQTVFLNYRMTD